MTRYYETRLDNRGCPVWAAVYRVKFAGHRRPGLVVAQGIAPRTEVERWLALNANGKWTIDRVAEFECVAPADAVPTVLWLDGEPSC